MLRKQLLYEHRIKFSCVVNYLRYNVLNGTGDRDREGIGYHAGFGP